MEARKPGRPRTGPLLDKPVTFRLWKSMLPMVEIGAKMQARRAKLPNRPIPSSSYGTWIRALIEHAFIHRADLPPEQARLFMHEASDTTRETAKVSMFISEEIRVKLRMMECELQAFDWSIDLDRNKTLLMIALAFAEQLNSQIKTTPLP